MGLPGYTTQAIDLNNINGSFAGNHELHGPRAKPFVANNYVREQARSVANVVKLLQVNYAKDVLQKFLD